MNFMTEESPNSDTTIPFVAATAILVVKGRNDVSRQVATSVLQKLKWREEVKRGGGSLCIRRRRGKEGGHNAMWIVREGVKKEVGELKIQDSHTQDLPFVAFYSSKQYIIVRNA